jgi:hypothetical protein
MKEGVRREGAGLDGLLPKSSRLAWGDPISTKGSGSGLEISLSMGWAKNNKR